MMFGIHELWLFIASGLLLNVTPGPDTAYIVGRGIQYGWRSGAAAALGISCGCLVHVSAAAIGLSALLMASSVAFTAVKWIGAAYLLLAGIQMLLSRASPIPDVAVPSERISLSRVFWQGTLTNVLNPKVALFFLAFVPQFIDRDAPGKAAAFVLLGALFNFNSLFVNVPVAWLASRSARRWRAGERAAQWLRRVTGGLFVLLAARLAALSRD